MNIVLYAQVHGKGGSDLNKLDNYEPQQIINDYERLHSARIVGERYGVAHSVVLRWLRKHGVDTSSNTCRKYHVNYKQMTCIDTPEKAYLLGYLASDGSIVKVGNLYRITFCCLLKDDELLDYCQEILQSNYPVYHVRGNQSQITINSRKLGEAFINLGIEPQKDFKCSIPQLEDSQLFHFARGFFDGDGHISQFKKYSTVVNISSNFKNLSKFQDLFAKYGCETTITKRKETPDDKDYGVILFNNIKSKYIFLKLIYNQSGKFKLTRKYNRAQEYIKWVENSQSETCQDAVTFYKTICPNASNWKPKEKK